MQKQATIKKQRQNARCQPNLKISDPPIRIVKSDVVDVHGCHAKKNVCREHCMDPGRLCKLDNLTTFLSKLVDEMSKNRCCIMSEFFTDRKRC